MVLCTERCECEKAVKGRTVKLSCKNQSEDPAATKR